jgi:hypothetical protein
MKIKEKWICNEVQEQVVCIELELDKGETQKSLSFIIYNYL